MSINELLALAKLIKDERKTAANTHFRVGSTFEEIIKALPSSIIASTDDTEPTDANVFAALRSLREIKERALSKTEADTAQELIKFLQGINTDSVESLTAFISGFLGTGYKIWMENGSSYIEADFLSIRKEAKFRTLTIEELKSVMGQIIASMANMKCTSVIEAEDRYECYFDNDGGNIGNPFRINDQARCQTFTGAGVKYYWRLVTGVGPDYINLSKTDCDGSGIPAEGDAIVQLGNRTDPTRQNAIIISSLEPSFKQYTGIHSYNLVGCEKTVISPSGNKFIGEFSTISGNEVIRIPADRKFWMEGMECRYYDRLSHKGALWLCVIQEGNDGNGNPIVTTDEPSLLSPAWEKQVSEGEDGTSPILTTISSLNGDNFHNGVISTIFTASVFRGGEDITSTLNQSCFKWVRKSADLESDAAWNLRYSTFGSNVLSINEDDVTFKAVFNCNVTITT